MRVHVPEAGKEELAASVDDRGASWSAECARVTDLDDPVAARDDCGVLTPRPISGIDHGHVDDGDSTLLPTCREREEPGDDNRRLMIQSHAQENNRRDADHAL